MLFMGHSTSGKSTISAIVSSKYPKLADDRVEIFQDQDCWRVRGADLIESNEDCQEPDLMPSVNVLGLIRIFKSFENSLDPIKPIDLCKHLLDAAFEVDFQRCEANWLKKRQIFFMLTSLAKKISGWSLNFQKNMYIINYLESRFDSE